MTLLCFNHDHSDSVRGRSKLIGNILFKIKRTRCCLSHNKDVNFEDYILRRIRTVHYRIVSIRGTMEFLMSADLFDNKARYGSFKQQTKNHNYKKNIGNSGSCNWSRLAFNGYIQYFWTYRLHAMQIKNVQAISNKYEKWLLWVRFCSLWWLLHVLHACRYSSWIYNKSRERIL